MAQESWLAAAVSAFGEACRDKLSGPMSTMGREAAIRSPLEGLLGAAGTQLRVSAIFHDEVRDTQRQVRPDYGVTVGGAISGYVEVKAPGRSIDPASFSGHDLTQWERQRDLPNLLYTNGTEWRLYRDGEPVGTPVYFTGGTLDTAGDKLVAPDGFEGIITDFLKWKPAPITSVGALVRSVAPLTRLLRGEVADQLEHEARAVAQGGDHDSQPFSGLAADWRALLFPSADDAVFADGYAQAVTFALLLARTEGIDLDGTSLHQVGQKLGAEHSLMGKALQLLTDDVARDFRVTLDLMVRVVGAVDWKRVRSGKHDTYLHLYEHFLEVYDNDLRKQSGTYYTPSEVVEHMVRLVDEALTTVLGRQEGFRDPDVHVVDPAMGTGTYLLSILERVARYVENTEGPGAVAGAVGALARRLNGFELQMGPYAVSELRVAELLAALGANSTDRANLFVTNTLDDPYVADNQLAHGLLPIAQSRRQANKVKANAHVTVVIGNPPYREHAEGLGGWVESGSAADGRKASGILDAFRLPGNGKFEYVLKNLYVYFWRWGTWKVWESTKPAIGGDAGVVCFITTSGYLRGPGFKGMREYLRRWSSRGWVIDLTPEGQRPDVSTRIFPGVGQTLAIGLFVRETEASFDSPSTILVRSLAGKRDDKFAQLASVSLEDDGWSAARTEWTTPFTPASSAGWDDFPALDDLMPWVTAGIAAHRTWVIAPSAAILSDRWGKFRGASDRAEASAMFKETRDRALDREGNPLPGVYGVATTPLSSGVGEPATAVRIGYRSFDRQWILPDDRVLDFARPTLWAASMPGQVFAVEQQSVLVSSGPGLVFSGLVPDLNHFNNRGGRTLPLLHPDGTPNLARGLAIAVASRLRLETAPTAKDLLAYVAAVVSHPGFTERFTDELETPGIRVPFTADPRLWTEAVVLGSEILRLHTYGATDPEHRPVTLSAGDPRKPLSRTAIAAMPEVMTYDSRTERLSLGEGSFGPVAREVWDYEVGGRNVLKSWFNYRKARPGGKKTSPLDYVHASQWDPAWTTELLELISVLTQLTDLETNQRDLLGEIVSGPLLSRSDFEISGVTWPTKQADRRPRLPLDAVTDGSTLL